MAGKFKGPADRLAFYDAVVATIAEVDLKGATTAYTSRNGWMFSFLDGVGEMSLRLSAADRDEFFSIYESRATCSTGVR